MTRNALFRAGSDLFRRFHNAAKEILAKPQPAESVTHRCDLLSKLTEAEGETTRTYGSDAMRQANTLVGAWMRAAGMTTRMDAIGNLIGHYAGAKPNARILLLGSHLDTVRNAGKFDGPLGVLIAIGCVEELNRQKIRLPFAIEVIGFADEEGVRYQTACLGSKVLAGCLDKSDLRRKDADGIALADAIRRYGGNPAQLKSAGLNPKTLLGYVEAHIEQGPVLEENQLALGTVTAIAGQTRARVTFVGRAGHAGTTPMSSRADALCAAAEFVLAVEKLAGRTRGLAATVGEISAQPGASNVIPGEVRLSLDLRHARDSVRRSARRALEKIARQIARRRKIRLETEVVYETASVKCSTELSNLLDNAVKRRQKKTIRLPSGAGHDAAVMAGITPTAMLFIRCKNGVSHHPDESVKTADVQMALVVMNDFLQSLAKKYRQNKR
ncbi:MAG TPA: allantoate amidohydrolase [Candidatus Acidoferrum sp.]|nr:allantoate amidohydrolase [Candidatus Acidoferrum sp.]